MKGLNALAGFSTGIGFQVWGQELAYAWVPYGELGNAQYLSFVMRFGGERTAGNLKSAGVGIPRSPDHASSPAAPGGGPIHQEAYLMGSPPETGGNDVRELELEQLLASANMKKAMQ